MPATWGAGFRQVELDFIDAMYKVYGLLDDRQRSKHPWATLREVWVNWYELIHAPLNSADRRRYNWVDPGPDAGKVLLEDWAIAHWLRTEDGAAAPWAVKYAELQCAKWSTVFRSAVKAGVVSDPLKQRPSLVQLVRSSFEAEGGGSAEDLPLPPGFWVAMEDPQQMAGESLKDFEKREKQALRRLQKSRRPQLSTKGGRQLAQRTMGRKPQHENHMKWLACWACCGLSIREIRTLFFAPSQKVPHKTIRNAVRRKAAELSMPDRKGTPGRVQE